MRQRSDREARSFVHAGREQRWLRGGPALAIASSDSRRGARSSGVRSALGSVGRLPGWTLEQRGSAKFRDSEEGESESQIRVLNVLPAIYVVRFSGCIRLTPATAPPLRAGRTSPARRQGGAREAGRGRGGEEARGARQQDTRGRRGRTAQRRLLAFCQFVAPT